MPCSREPSKWGNETKSSSPDRAEPSTLTSSLGALLRPHKKLPLPSSRKLFNV